MKKMKLFLKLSILIISIYMVSCKNNNTIVIYSCAEDYRNEFYLTELEEKFPEINFVLDYQGSGAAAAADDHEQEAHGLGGLGHLSLVEEGEACRAQVHGLEQSSHQTVGRGHGTQGARVGPLGPGEVHPTCQQKHTCGRNGQAAVEGQAPPVFGQEQVLPHKEAQAADDGEHHVDHQHMGVMGKLGKTAPKELEPCVAEG